MSVITPHNSQTNLNQIAPYIHAVNVEKGFWKEDNTAQKLMLIVSELSEACEADRRIDNSSIQDKNIEDSKFLLESGHKDWRNHFEISVKNSFGDELADAIIRIVDLAYKKNIDLDWHIKAKLLYNESRPKMHGKKY